MTLQLLTSFLGWCLVLNFVILGVAAIFLVLFGDMVRNIHAKMFNLSNEQLTVQYFAYLANYKIMIVMFNLTPYVALKLLAN